MNEFFKYDTCILYMYMLRETLLLDTNPPLSCDTSCRQLIKVDLDRERSSFKPHVR